MLTASANANITSLTRASTQLTLAVLPPIRTDYGRLPLLCSAQLPPRTTSPVHVDDPTPVPTGNISVPHRISTTVCACVLCEGLDIALDVDSGLCPKFGAARLIEKWYLV